MPRSSPRLSTIYVLEKGRVVLYYAMWRQQIGERDAGEIMPEKQPAPLPEPDSL